MEIEITWYKDSMKNQVITLFENQYGTAPGYFADLFEKFYFHSYQEKKCLLIVAMDGSTVAGFQSFFHWPYVKDNKELNSFQSGNSLVHPGYRGKGIFQKMLAFIDKENKTLELDFLMGFPVEASLKNFLKDNWKNILDLKWFFKLCNPFGFFSNNLKHLKNMDAGIIYPGNTFITHNHSLRLSDDPAFIDWRKNYISAGTSYFTYHFKKNNSEITFHLKKNKRKNIFNELIIGNILFKDFESRLHLDEALREINKLLLQSFSTHFISCAINKVSQKTIKNELEKNGFKELDKSIYFIVKPFKQEDTFLDPSAWELYRSDIDTW